jgi:MYXO-CTERM domain-containing protein
LNLGFDISGETGLAYFAIENDSTFDNGIYTADLSSLASRPNVDFNVGITPENSLALTRIADFGGYTIVDITVVPEASSFFLAAAGLVGLLAVRRRI